MPPTCPSTTPRSMRHCASRCSSIYPILARPPLEAARVLRSGGVLIASVPNVAFWRRRLDLVCGRWNPEGDDLSVAEPWRDPHLRFLTTAALRSHAAASRVRIGGGKRWTRQLSRLSPVCRLALALALSGAPRQARNRFSPLQSAAAKVSVSSGRCGYMPSRALRDRKTPAAAALRGHVAILSPHLDDAVYSLGAAIGESARCRRPRFGHNGFRGDPSSTRPASPWDRRFGFGWRGSSACPTGRRPPCLRLARRLAGLAAVRRSSTGRRSGDGRAVELVEDAVGHADSFSFPGSPRPQGPPAAGTGDACRDDLGPGSVGLYAEQPYAAVRGAPPSVPSQLASLVPGEPEWRALEVAGSRRAGARCGRGARTGRNSRHFGYRSLVNVDAVRGRYGGELTALL